MSKKEYISHIVPRFSMSNAADAVHTMYDGACVEFAIQIGEAFFIITKQMMSHLGLSLEQLEEIAIRNILVQSNF